jgi:GNAT superfamily N-acetyltransferase
MIGKKIPFTHSDATYIEVEEFDNHIYVHSLVIKEERRNLGTGTKIMEEIISYAKRKNKPLVGFASHELGGDINSLNRWYKKLGFHEEYNKIETDFNYNIRID